MELGSIVKDKITGFKGIAVAKHLYLFGCERITVQPTVDADGKLILSETFDAPSLEVVGESTVVPNNTTGGPDKYQDIRRY